MFPFVINIYVIAKNVNMFVFDFNNLFGKH